VRERWIYSWTALIASCLFWQIASAQDEGSARHFLEGVYSHYGKHSSPDELFGSSLSQVFAPSLVELIRADQKALKGEAGVLGMDPICACQDYDISSLQLLFEARADKRLGATATFDNLGRSTVVHLDLVPVGDQWRIDDIQTPGMDSLRRALDREIASRKK
jgi:hypothetical protein